MKKEATQWLTIAKEDRDLAEEMRKTKRYVYAIMFWQQAVEKILKAYIVEKIDTYPKKTHDLGTLLKQARLKKEELTVEDIKELSLAFTRTRYEDLSRKHYMKRSVVEPLIVKAERLYIWVQNQLTQL
jgi:HEPN domain-containing protein